MCPETKRSLAQDHDTRVLSRSDISHLQQDAGVQRTAVVDVGSPVAMCTDSPSSHTVRCLWQSLLTKPTHIPAVVLYILYVETLFRVDVCCRLQQQCQQQQ